MEGDRSRVGVNIPNEAIMPNDASGRNGLTALSFLITDDTFKHSVAGQLGVSPGGLALSTFHPGASGKSYVMAGIYAELPKEAAMKAGLYEPQQPGTQIVDGKGVEYINFQNGKATRR